MSIQFLLTSNFPQEGNEPVASYLLDSGFAGRIAWMAPRPDAERFKTASDEFACLGLGPLIDISEGGAAAIGSQTSAVYLSGGDPLLFRDRLHATGMSQWLAHNATIGHPLPVIAASGGAMQLTMNVSLFRLATLDLAQVLRERAAFRGLGLTRCEVIPHLGRQPLPFLRSAKQYVEQTGAHVWCLPDSSAIAFRTEGEPVPLGAATVL